MFEFSATVSLPLFQTYSVDWKRNAFFKFVEVFHDNNWPQELKAKVMIDINMSDI